MTLTTNPFSPEAIPQTLNSTSSPLPAGFSFPSYSLSNFSNFSGAIPSPNASAGLHISIRIVLLVIGAVGIIGNLQVTIVMVSYEPLRRRLANYFLINQCILDLIVNIFVILLYSGDSVSSVVNGIIGELKCRLWLSRSVLLGLFTSSLLSMTAMAVERYAEIVYPIQHKLRMNRQLVTFSLVVINLAGVSYKLLIIAPTATIVNGVCVNGKFPNLYVKKLVGVVVLLFEFLVPLTVIGYCYVGMARSLKRRVQPTSSKTFDNARQNIINTLLIIVLLFIACTMLKQTLGLMYYFDAFLINGYNEAISNIAVLLAYSNCCFNPLVYFLKYNEFQKGVRWLYCRRRCIKTRNCLV